MSSIGRAPVGRFALSAATFSLLLTGITVGAIGAASGATSEVPQDARTVRSPTPVAVNDKSFKRFRPTWASRSCEGRFESDYEESAVDAV